ncbi:hypothetical protein CALVIDRAFT_295035 [Calocera viscosa TUFC12733]|uniref:NAD(P)-binding protein n=1 Tax=Calocera viscosa (strain TUFC12733) TaxID=1330018 RepID=A0A167IMX9_CALVF|nr:hypothetical protein CALVIDRAFT_295035 [Calocera viscosa TUFC12733]
MGTPMSQLTKQGFDLQFGTNVFGHAYLTMLLLPTLLATAQASPPGSVRVINDSSQVHMGAGRGGIDYDTLKPGPGRDKMGSMLAYNQSKWGNVVFAKELARRYGAQGIVSTSLNPGAIRTEIFRHLPRLLTISLTGSYSTLTRTERSPSSMQAQPPRPLLRMASTSYRWQEKVSLGRILRVQRLEGDCGNLLRRSQRTYRTNLVFQVYLRTSLGRRQVDAEHAGPLRIPGRIAGAGFCCQGRNLPGFVHEVPR